MLRLSLIIFLLLLATVTAHAADAYKWTDAQGNAHFGDVPPEQPAQQKERIALPKEPSPAPPSQDNQPGLRPAEMEMLKELDSAAEKEGKARQEAQREAEEKEQTERELCQKYTQLLKEVKTANSAIGSRYQALAEGNYAEYKDLRKARHRRALRREYAENVKQYCK